MSGVLCSVCIVLFRKQAGATPRLEQVRKHNAIAASSARSAIVRPTNDAQWRARQCDRLSSRTSVSRSISREIETEARRDTEIYELIAISDRSNSDIFWRSQFVPIAY